MRRVLIAFAIAAIVLGGVFVWVVRNPATVVEKTLPAFPDWPDPVVRLTDERAGEIHFATTTPYDFDVLLRAPDASLPTTGLGTLFLPDAASAATPAPAMIVLHGSGGIHDSREMATGRMLAEHGIASFVVDYYAPRGIVADTPYMLRVFSVTEFDAVADAYAALRLLSTHPAIDGDRIGVMGFSYGGMATRIAMDDRVRQALAPEHPGFAAHVDVYGPCFQVFGTRSTNGAPLLTLRGSEDASNELPACERREAELRTIGVAVESHVYEGAGHAWEADVPRFLSEDSPYVAGCEVVYDENGHSSVDGRPIVAVDPRTPRAERVAIRIGSGAAMQDCVGYGYLIGRDDETRAKADAAILDFLRRTLRPGA